jgi:hypothetical protein
MLMSVDRKLQGQNSITRRNAEDTESRSTSSGLATRDVSLARDLDRPYHRGRFTGDPARPEEHMSEIRSDTAALRVSYSAYRAQPRRAVDYSFEDRLITTAETAQ